MEFGSAVESMSARDAAVTAARDATTVSNGFTPGERSVSDDARGDSAWELDAMDAVDALDDGDALDDEAAALDACDDAFALKALTDDCGGKDTDGGTVDAD